VRSIRCTIRGKEKDDTKNEGKILVSQIFYLIQKESYEKGINKIKGQINRENKSASLFDFGKNASLSMKYISSKTEALIEMEIYMNNNLDENYKIILRKKSDYKFKIRITNGKYDWVLPYIPLGKEGPFGDEVWDWRWTKKTIAHNFRGLSMEKDALKMLRFAYDYLKGYFVE